MISSMTFAAVMIQSYLELRLHANSILHSRQPQPSPPEEEEGEETADSFGKWLNSMSAPWPPSSRGGEGITLTSPSAASVWSGTPELLWQPRRPAAKPRSRMRCRSTDSSTGRGRNGTRELAPEAGSSNQARYGISEI